MLPQNYQQKKVMDSMLRDYKIGQHFGSDSKKQGLMELMVKHNVTKDPRNMKDYEKKAFLHDVKSMRSNQLSIEGKRAFENMYGSQKPQQVNVKENKNQQERLKQASYSEIMAKKKMQDEKIASINSTAKKSSIWNLIGIKSVKKESATRDLVKRSDNYYEDGKADNYDDTRDAINRIQS